MIPPPEKGKEKKTPRATSPKKEKYGRVHLLIKGSTRSPCVRQKKGRKGKRKDHNKKGKKEVLRQGKREFC